VMCEMAMNSAPRRAGARGGPGREGIVTVGEGGKMQRQRPGLEDAATGVMDAPPREERREPEPAAEGVMHRIKRVAIECLEKADWDHELAAKLYHERLEEDPALFRELMRPLVGGAIWAVVRECGRDNNRGLRGEIGRGQEQHRTVEGIEEHGRDLLRYTLPIAGRPFLGDATREQLEEAAAFHEKNGHTHLVQARWYGLIVKAMREAECVRAALDHAALQQLLTKARRVR